MTSDKQDNGRPMPAFDEGWWEAILAEEGSQLRQRASRPPMRLTPREDSRLEHRVNPNWEQVKRLFESDEIVDLRVTGCNRGGLLVEGEELSGFVPFSHLLGVPGASQGTDRSPMLEGYVGRTLRLKVIECVPEDGRVVFSERAAQAEPGRRAQIFHSLRVGERVRGSVTNITDFGVFVDLGGVEGLIHISELSWGRVLHPGDIVKLGEAVDVQVLELSPERCRVALSLKRLLPNPWIGLEADLGAGVSVPAVITSVLSYGAFARLERGVEGLIHISEMPLAEGQAVRELLHEGQEVLVRVLHVDAGHQRMGLSMKAVS
ncbi:MAG TPA: S1 RNA-binding domain-containing protein [Anaerolineales bacterium]|nr:S1 RNA-binding domain-containing protein [Anaerolineales bacterium]